MRISLCIGDYAQIPYEIPGLELRVSSVEELCYCLKENAFLLDMSLMRADLIEWIDTQCGLRGLANELAPMVRRQGALSAFVTLIQEYVGFYDRDTIAEVEKLLRKGSGLSPIEKRKNQVDYLVRSKKYAAAVRGYDELLERWREAEDQGGELPMARVRAAILHNKGAALAGMMCYSQAAECFRQAHELEQTEDSYLVYLAAKRMELSESEYIAFAAEQPDRYVQTMKVEKIMERLKANWPETPEYMRLERRRRQQEGDGGSAYYDESESIVQALIGAYRVSAGE